MEWDAMVLRQREALKIVLAGLVAMAGRYGGDTLPRCVHRAVLRLLRPAEAAARRLVIALARGLPAPPAAKTVLWTPRTKPAILSARTGTGILLPRAVQAAARPPGPKRLALPLFDPLRAPWRHRRSGPASVPRILLPGITKPFPVAPRHPPSPDDPLDAARLRMRLAALADALDDLPHHARRFLRWQARLRAATAQATGIRPTARIRRGWPLRPGRPPGWSRKPSDEVHHILNEAQWLALAALKAPDTS